MPKMIKILLPILGAVALLFHPALGIYASGLSGKEFLSAVAFNIAFFIASSAMFYSMWLWRYKTLKNADKDAFRGAPALLGYFALFLGIPISVIFSIFDYYVTSSASPEFSLGPGMLGAATAGLVLGYRLPKVNGS